MIRLLYISYAASNLKLEDVRAILKVSRAQNKAHDITGVLIHGGGMFMQILEGPEPAVLQLYVNITRDKRNHDARIVLITPTDTRLFDSWAMGNIDCEPQTFERLAKLRSQKLEAATADSFAEFALEYAKMLRGQTPSM